MRVAIWLAAPLLCTSLSVPAAASLADYVAARKRFPPRPQASLAALQANPDRWRNSVVELKGTVAGVSRSDSAASLLLRSASGDILFIAASQEASLPASGENVRVLATVEGSDRFSLLSVATEAEIGNTVLDPPKPKKAAAPTKRSRASGMPVRWPVVASRSMVASRMGVDPRIAGMYKDVVRRFNHRLSDEQAAVIARTIVDASYVQGVDARFIMAILASESEFRISATSRCGAMGLGQLMPSSARALGVTNPYDPQQNILGSVRLLQQHWSTYSSKGYDFTKVFRLVCAAYNAGPGAVRKYGGVPPYRETQNYVKRVAKWYRAFAPELFD